MQTKHLFVSIHIWNKGEVGAPFNGLSSPVKYFTDRSKAVLLLWIFYVFLSCVCYACVRICLYVPCGHLLGKGWPLGSICGVVLWVCYFPICILGQVWYLIVSIPDLCTLTFFERSGLLLDWDFFEHFVEILKFRWYFDLVLLLLLLLRILI